MTEAVLIAVALDLAFGDPRRLPHPVRGLGGLARWAERTARNLFAAHPRTAGLLCQVTVVTVSGLTAAAILWFAQRAGDTALTLATAVMIYYTIALRDLIAHGLRVKRALDRQDLDDARKKVAMIVSRDTGSMDRQEVVRATVESLAENLVDAVAAPLFWAVCFGPVAAVIYRAVNTCDAMFGYKNERYRDFGLFSARVDDLANLIPARITGVVLCLAALVSGLAPIRAARILLRDHGKHQSPNGGHPEAAVAGALGIRLGGPGNYFGTIINKPELGDDLRPPEPRDITRTARLILIATAIFLFLVLAARIIIAG